MRKYPDMWVDPEDYRTAADRDGAFTGAVAEPSVVAEAWQRWREEVAFAEKTAAEAALEVVAAGDDELTMAELLVHMIEEYARHNGHADLIRERLDGRTGQ